MADKIEFGIKKDHVTKAIGLKFDITTENMEAFHKAYMDAKSYIDIEATIDGQTKTFTWEEFKVALGFAK